MGAEPHAIAGSSLAASASVDGYNSADEHEVAVSAPAETIEAFAARMAATRGLQLVPMLRDGNCLFRAVADRVYGDHAMHDVVRQQTLDHVAAESAHFSPYVAEDIHTYVARKRRDGVYGNHVELQALSELYNRRVEAALLATAAADSDAAATEAAIEAQAPGGGSEADSTCSALVAMGFAAAAAREAAARFGADLDSAVEYLAG
ncbi:hypothetical protein EMIHUDRAFT_97842 [Emiliania huxleyi CCMP1516]|uniref:ubiquitinyl hydrolase 1 n=2 Tax=Emiliania huxleyi TaxID=2903 RepID=A0A0D3KV85_EMIH1|nr:hypothetical protein EMIHUDRAFT_97842 [Emiliania huxleyi CCMP1516]EOD39670.1 hypothetical protein EMIHUDRAFT_97842 [Emiliania huxleyi CCMP1516]|eukprot:XP_005792099.1 hypothetical protein EMIHUDRAFT_97842 [Emiliania huxleyi CCMP1516]